MLFYLLFYFHILFCANDLGPIGLLCFRPDRAEALSDDARLTSDVWRLSVALSRTSGREQRGLGRLKLAQR